MHTRWIYRRSPSRAALLNFVSSVVGTCRGIGVGVPRYCAELRSLMCMHELKIEMPSVSLFLAVIGPGNYSHLDRTSSFIFYIDTGEIIIDTI